MGRRGEMYQADVLDVLRDNGAPLSAYDVLAVLRQDIPKIAPPTVYRALAALTERGLVHRLESLNAFIACKCKSHEHAILSICDDCGCVEENVAPELLSQLSSLTGQTGFQAERHVVEIHGVCASCSEEESPA